MSGLFEGAAVIVTGAASGLGAASARRFAEEGAWVLAVDIDEGGADATATSIRNAGGSAEAGRVDVCRSDDLDAAVARAVAACGRLDVMFNNAGIVFNASIEETSEAEWRRVIDVNLTGVFLGCKAAIPQMVAQGGGAIVNTASVAGLVAAFNDQPAYIASKGGVVMLTRALALDYADRGIRVNCVCPGVMETSMIDEFLATRFATDEERTQARIGLHAVQPIGHMSRPEDVAKTVLFLASSDAADITGVALPVDGGLVAR